MLLTKYFQNLKHSLFGTYRLQMNLKKSASIYWVLNVCTSVKISKIKAKFQFTVSSLLRFFNWPFGQSTLKTSDCPDNFWFAWAIGQGIDCNLLMIVMKIWKLTRRNASGEKLNWTNLFIESFATLTYFWNSKMRTLDL